MYEWDDILFVSYTKNKKKDQNQQWINQSIIEHSSLIYYRRIIRIYREGAPLLSKTSQWISALIYATRLFNEMNIGTGADF